MTDATVLIGKYTVSECDQKSFDRMLEDLHPIAFPDIVEFRRRELLTDHQVAARDRLRNRTADRFVLRYVVRLGDDIVGWSLGVQATSESFRMANSAVLPEHRRKGIYSALLHHILDRTRREGFQLVTSHHHPTNNAVLIAKLRAGFIITGMEVTDDYGTLVNLGYYFDDHRRRAIGVRVGAERPDERIRSLMERPQH